MDPLSIASAVVGIAGFGLQVHQALFAFVTNVSNADQCVQALITDINLTVSALRSIHDSLKKGKYEVATNDQDPNYLRLNRADILSKLERINWTVAQTQVDLYTARLVTFKVSLLLIFSVISLKAQHQDLNNNDIISYIDDLQRRKLQQGADGLFSKPPSCGKSHYRSSHLSHQYQPITTPWNHSILPNHQLQYRRIITMLQRLQHLPEIKPLQITLYQRTVT